MTYDTKREQALLALLRDGGERGLTLREISDQLTPDGKGKSTIFRLLAALSARGVIRKLPDDRGHHFVYQYTESEHCHHHLHLKCTDCGRFIHLTDQLSALLCDALRKEGHFTLDGERSILCGKCAACKGGETV